jgi:fumarate hydratase subunit alpha
MRNVSVQLIRDAVRKMAVDANYNLSGDIYEALGDMKKRETSQIGNAMLDNLIENADIARKGIFPICQDTGMAIVFVELGQDVHLEGGLLEDAINEGVRLGYEEGFLRKSVVGDPLQRKNTNDNTPAVIHVKLVEGSKVRIKLSPKGFGSENMSRIKMLNPSDGQQGVIDFVLETVEMAGPNPCPPIVVGVGIGGSFEKAALMAKEALFRDVTSHSSIDHVKELETLLLGRINELGIGPQGLGGINTAIGVNIEVYPTHIAGLPVAVNISCHATRHMETEI